jgi:glucosamine-6-phosphate deaminase
MEIIIRPTAEAAAALTARLIAARINNKPALVLGLATGRTMEQVYRELIALHRAGKVDFAACTTFNLDEYAGLEASDPTSYHTYMREALFTHVNLRPEHTHLPCGVAADLAAECQAYEDLIKNAGGIDLQLLGIGATGHIGFNEPLSALLSRTRVKALTQTTREQNAFAFGGDPTRVPPRALTMGVGTILEAREIVLLATGAAKAEILARALEGPLTAAISASALQMHPCCKIIVDEAAAGALRGSDYYRQAFELASEWASLHA